MTTKVVPVYFPDGESEYSQAPKSGDSFYLDIKGLENMFVYLAEENSFAIGQNIFCIYFVPGPDYFAVANTTYSKRDNGEFLGKVYNQFNSYRDARDYIDELTERHKQMYNA